LNDAKATSIHSLNSVGKLELNGGRSNHRRLAAPIFLLNSLGHATLASRQLLV
jgi:hypothetical protein